MGKATTVPIPRPAGPTHASASAVSYGHPIQPIDRVKIFSATQWEEFVLEWADSLVDEYSRVDRCGGSGDMGRDIVAICSDAKDGWDNYQCKHYQHALAPSDVWIELGKLVYYTYIEEYTYPRKYHFVAPQGAGTKLANLLRRPADLRAGLIDSWDDKCRTRIT
ncbi:MAG: hypothetical protein OXC95_08210 [Dehalococcoidia bacterium]|nr:hypothetical protein [Dehalococcoidia bacterium]